MTRAEFSKMLCLAFSIRLNADFTSFADITKDDWFYSYAVSLNMAGIINGTSLDEFSPHLALTRESAAAMLVRIYEKAKGGNAPSGEMYFSDSAIISDWAQSDVKKAAALEIIQGNPDGTFSPSNNITRAEAAAIIYRLARILSR